MTTYRLPEVLGGGEVEPCADEPDYPKVGFDLPGVSGLLWLDRVDLIEVVPPLPEEPPVGSVVRADFRPKDRPDVEPWVFEHAEIAAPNGKEWYGAGRDEAFSWAEICALGTPVRLVPEPVMEPVALPWKSHGVEVQQTTLDGGPGNHVHVSTKDASYGFAHLTPDTADAMAAALTTAAAKARQS